MAEEKLLNYIRDQLQRGKTKEEIKKELLGVGWQEKDIEEAFNLVGVSQQFAAPSISAETFIPSTLPGVGDLLKRTFSVYKRRLGTFVGIMIIPLVVLILSLILFFLTRVFSVFSGASLFIILFLIIWVVAMIIIGSWSQVSLIFAIKDREEKIGIIESYKRGWHKIIPFIWVSFLVSFITLGGSVLFIIPGIIFSIWFTFSTYVLVSEDLRGMNALFRSKQLVVGYWWKALWRFFVMAIVVFLPVMLIYGILTEVIFMILPGFTQNFINLSETIFRIISSLFITPFTVTFRFLLYEDLKRQKAQIPFEPPKKGTRIKYILIGIIGFLLIPAIFVSIIFSSIWRTRVRAKGASVMASMSQFPLAMELYAEKNNYSYNGANCSLPDFVPICNEIKKYTGEMPTIKSSDENYCSYVKLPSGEYFCVSNYSSVDETFIFPGGKGYCDGITFKCP